MSPLRNRRQAPDAGARLSCCKTLGRRNIERVQRRGIHLPRDRQTIANLIPRHRGGCLTVVPPIWLSMIKAGLLQPDLQLMHRFIGPRRSETQPNHRQEKQKPTHDQ